MKVEQYTLDRELIVYRFGDEEISTLLVREGRSILIDCHHSALKEELLARDLPLPELILHTHISPEHCCEGEMFGESQIRVPQGLEILASDPAGYRRLADTRWDDPDDWMKTMGREPFGVGGSVTSLPPEVPLRIGDSLVPGGHITWNGLTLEIISLPAHGRHAIGLLLKEEIRPLAFFPGDLFRHRAHLVNVYDLVTCYGGTALAQMPELLRMTAALGPRFFFPATGEAMEDGPAEAEELAVKITAYLDSLAWSSGSFTPGAPAAGQEAGPFTHVGEGIFQDKGFGNTIVLIGTSGRALVVDPGPCGYGKGITLGDREKSFSAGFDYLEEVHGLSSVELILVTHMHGDHYDMVPLLKRRYGARLATWSVLAEILEEPTASPCSCLMPWYNLGLGAMKVDTHLPLGPSFDWNGSVVTVVHTPGHSHAHCSFVLDFRGERLAITGDTIQSRGEACTLGFVTTNDSEPFGDGMLQSFERLAGRGITLNLGGHGSRFRHCEAMYQESILRIRHALGELRGLLHGENFDRIFRAPCMRRGS